MPIRPEHRHFHPIDWPQLSTAIRFGRAGGRCETCGRPHGQVIVCLDAGTWYDADAEVWRNGRGLPLRRSPGLAALAGARLTQPILATCHRGHDTSRNGDRDLAAWCQRCHLIHDRPEHLRRRRLTYLRRRALGDLLFGPTRSRRTADEHGLGAPPREGSSPQAEIRKEFGARSA